ncbi:MAG: hypothetical protein BMS9Abin28_2577 [Anaerolineae bacterium]|nr:MAG: hypothetical protein BMS9Abin28_2577 [Anaerolineae bacterium]
MVTQVADFLDRHGRLILAGVLIVQVVGGSIYAISLGDAIVFADERDYLNLATNLWEKHLYTQGGLNPTAFRPPGYPLILSLGYGLGGRVVHLRILNFVALAISTYLLNRMLKRNGQPLGATLSSLIVLGYPVLFYAAGTLFPQTIATTLFLSAIFLITGDRPNWVRAILAGLILGYVVLMVPLFLFVLVVVPGYSLWKKEPSIGIAMAVVVSSSLVFGLWSFRNYVVFDRFVFISSNSGYNLLLGNSAASTPSAGVTEELTRYYFEGGRELGLDEIDRDNYFRAEVMDYMLKNPLQASGFYLQKVLNYFNYRNELRTDSESSELRDLLMLTTYGPLLVLMAVRIVLIRRFPLSSLEQLFAVLYIASAFASAVFFTRIRFRLPFDFLLIGIVAAFLDQLLREKVTQRT